LVLIHLKNVFRDLKLGIKVYKPNIGGKMKINLFTTIIGTLLISGNSHAQLGPQITDAQRSCLEGKIGKPGFGTRPSPDQMKTAFESCGIEAPQGGPGSKFHRHELNLTEEQRTCLEDKIGKPGSGSRPSREQLDSAFGACGIAHPDFGIPENFPTLKVKFAAATTDEERNEIRESIHKIFYTTNDRSLKMQVRQFLRDNPQLINWSNPEVESASSDGMR
jgi:hypothetical protein